ncbi:hypothetical protein [Nocardia rhizosphaerihabitans]|nr:hypothetical protein [Nocardia rhizosphaerihabitans]
MHNSLPNFVAALRISRTLPTRAALETVRSVAELYDSVASL